LNERRIHQVFKVSVLLKGAHALIECLSGILLAFVDTDTIQDFASGIAQYGLSKDADDFVATHLLAWAQGFSLATKNFYALYLLSHGLIKVLLVVGLLRNKLWSYPASIVVLGVFIVYQLYRFSHTHGVGLILLSIFDIIVLGLIWHEYRLVRRHLGKRPARRVA
jgi:uncharacterized membrane protein